jgi:hypothetical protein
MKTLVNLIDKAKDTMDEIEWYAEKAHHIRTEHKALADIYIKVAEMHIDIYKMLHEQMIDLIDEERRKGKIPPPEMLAVWEYEHERLVKEFAEAKYLVEDYKKSY